MKTANKELSEEEKFMRTELYRKNLPVYKERVTILVKKCIGHDIIPIMITQPLLDNSFTFESLQLYNQVTKEVCTENKILCVDLGNKLEKNSRYFYDNMHFTNYGTEKIAKIIFTDLSEYLEANKNDLNLK